MRLPRLKLRQRLSRPARLPQWFRAPSSVDTPRIYDFNDERDSVVAEVVARLVEQHAGAGQSELEIVLSETAHAEIHRLERQKDEESRESLGFWRGLVRKLSKLDPDERRDALEQISSRMARDVAGNFDPRVYWVAQRLVPRVIAGVMNPPALAREFLAPGRGELDSMVTVEGCVPDLHRLSRRGTLIYVPTHSSNLDSLALGDSLSQEGLPPVVYGAGKNLFTNPIISFFMHNLGAYRVDRRIRAELYKEVLKAYSTVMIERGYHSLFFPGGTRGRSGMVERHLKLGLTGTGVEAYARNCLRVQPGTPERRIYFVPVTINYSVVLEAETLIEDYLKETGQARYIIEDDEFSRIDRWVAFFNKLQGQDASCVLRFGRPLDPFGNDVDDAGDSLSPNGRVVDPRTYVSRGGVPVLDPARDAGYTRELGRVLLDRYRSETVVMSTQLVAHLMFRRLVEQTPGVSLFGRMRRRGDFAADHGALVQEIGHARDRLLELEAAGELRVSPFLRREAPERTLERALSGWSYHRKTLLRPAEGRLVLEDPSLALYYQNRLVDWSESLVEGWPPISRRAAAEIRKMGGGR